MIFPISISKDTISELTDLSGIYVEGEALINAKDYGIPQNRNRTFMVSILGSYELKSSYKLAGDTSGDGEINALDLLQVQKNILGSYEIK